jgi:hypothetical protein
MEPALLVTVAAVTVAAVAVVVAVVGAVALRGSRAERRRLASQVVATHADVEALRERVEELSRRPAAGPTTAGGEVHEFVITSLPDGTLRGTPAVPDDEPVPTATPLSAGQFASVALGESVVRVLSLGYGVRRALSAENRNRIRFEMRREVKRSRRQRRRDLKEAKRHLRADQRADLTEDAA